MTIRLNDTYIKPFIDEAELSAIKADVTAAHKTLLDGNGEGNDFLGWVDLPNAYDKEEYARIKAAAAKIQKTCDVFVVIGISISCSLFNCSLNILGTISLSDKSTVSNIYLQFVTSLFILLTVSSIE